MSKRHRDEKPLRNPKEVRRMQQRAARHREHQTLHEAGDVEAVLFDEPRTERRPIEVKSSVGRRVRHWKLKSWKRRTALQSQRNAELNALMRAD